MPCGKKYGCGSCGATKKKYGGRTYGYGEDWDDWDDDDDDDDDTIDPDYEDDEEVTAPRNWRRRLTTGRKVRVQGKMVGRCPSGFHTAVGYKKTGNPKTHCVRNCRGWQPPRTTGRLGTCKSKKAPRADRLMKLMLENDLSPSMAKAALEASEGAVAPSSATQSIIDYIARSRD